MTTTFNNILLWMFVINLGVAFGAGHYEQRESESGYLHLGSYRPQGTAGSGFVNPSADPERSRLTGALRRNCDTED